MSTVLQRKDWMTVAETAEELGVTTGRVRQLLINGFIRGEKFGKAWAISTREIKRFSKIRRPVGNPNFRRQSDG